MILARHLILLIRPSQYPTSYITYLIYCATLVPYVRALHQPVCTYVSYLCILYAQNHFCNSELHIYSREYLICNVIYYITLRIFLYSFNLYPHCAYRILYYFQVCIILLKNKKKICRELSSWKGYKLGDVTVLRYYYINDCFVGRTFHFCNLLNIKLQADNFASNIINRLFLSYKHFLKPKIVFYQTFS